MAKPVSRRLKSRQPADTTNGLQAKRNKQAQERPQGFRLLVKG